MNMSNWLSIRNLKYLGEGAQGKVYLLNKRSCIKIYKNPRYLPFELANLQKASKKTKIFPKVYQWGNNFMVRKYIKGTALDKYLKNHPLSKSISRQLIGLIKTFKKIGFSRLDTQLNNIIITPKGVLHPIDPTSAMLYKKKYPQVMLQHLKKLGLKRRFLQHIKKIDRHISKNWK